MSQPFTSALGRLLNKPFVSLPAVLIKELQEMPDCTHLSTTVKSAESSGKSLKYKGFCWRHGDFRTLAGKPHLANNMRNQRTCTMLFFRTVYGVEPVADPESTGDKQTAIQCPVARYEGEFH
jgi:hypothetical protein